MSSVPRIDTDDLWIRFRLIERERAPFVERFLRYYPALTAERVKALFVNHSDGSELDLTDADSTD